MARSQTATTYSFGSVSSAPTYIAASKIVSDMLKAVFTQTTDTGQVIWSGTGAVTALPAVDTVRDYEIYRFNDTLQSSAPIFFRIDYFYSSGVYEYVSLRVGTGTDGAGNLLNSISIAQLMSAAQNGSTGYASTGDGSLATVLLNVVPTSLNVDTATGWFCIERFRNADGSASAEGFNVYIGRGNAFTFNYSRNNITTPALLTETNVPVVIPNVSGPTTAFSGSTAIAFPFYTWGPQVRGASQGVLMGYQGDWPRLTEVSLTHYGKAMKFLPLGNASSIIVMGRQLFSPLLRWE